MRNRLWTKLAAVGMGMTAVVVALVLGACGMAPSKNYAAVDYANMRNGNGREEIWIVPTGPAGGASGEATGNNGMQNGQLTMGLLGSTDYGMASAGSGVGGGGGRGAGGGAGGRGVVGGAGVGTGSTGRAGSRGGVRGPATAPADQGISVPGSPILAARRADGALVIVPLKHTEVEAKISGYIASVGVTQEFTNPSTEKIEAVYVFPLPENAGVSEFTMTIGERHIRGIIRERTEAERIYQQARAQGYVASLMTQERPNIFTQNVANIEPGKSIDIAIRYFHTLTYNDGWYEWVFPMVVGPRYNPAGSTNGVGAVPAGQAGISGQRTEVEYLRPEERSGHDIGLKVAVDAGMKIEELVSVNHRVRQSAGANHSTVVQLDPADTYPNKDFVLRYKVAGERVKTGLFVQKDKEGKGGWFSLMIVPPEDLKSLPRRNVEMVFVVDTSGSMSGQPIAQAKQAVGVALSKMQAGDTFQVVKFAARAEQMSPQPVAVTADAIARAQQYVTVMQGEGRTEMLQGINAALGFPHDENRTRVVAFLTDGYIGNETQILKALHAQLQDSRVFSFGVGTSVNRYLLDAMARLGHGNAAYLSLNEPAEPVMADYFARISHPALANVKVQFNGMQVSEVYPQRMPELFVGRPIVITGRFTGEPKGNVTISGRAGEQAMTYSLSAAGTVEENPAIATVWARAKLTDLHDEAVFDERDVRGDVTSTALSYGIMSEYTSFVAVDSTVKTAGGSGERAVVPVPVPEGVRYETTVRER